jgi:hypothetical protein
MTLRTNAIILAVATIALPAAFAQSAGRFVGGEAGWVDRPVQTSGSSSQVANEFLQFRANPVAADGGRYVGGEEGYAFPAHTYAIKNGQWVCTDKIAHNPKPDAIKSPVEEKLFQRVYPA